MADYYTRTVVTGAIPLTNDMLTVVEARGATTYPVDEESVLDAIVNERPPIKSYHVVFEDGWRSHYSDDVDWELEELGIEEGITDEIKRLVMMDMEDFLHESLKLDTEMGHIETQSGWGCSKMRLDGFGGSALIVTRKGYLYLTTTQFKIDEDGIAEHSGGFKFWEDEDEQPKDA